MLAWDAEATRWIDDATGDAVGAAAVIAARDALADEYAAQFRALALIFTAGGLTVQAWTGLFATLLMEAIAHGYLFGRGGLERMGDADWERVTEVYARQHDFATRFIAEVEHQIEHRPAGTSAADVLEQIAPSAAARAELYAGSVVESYEQGHVAAVSEHRGRLRMPVYPADGGTQCVVSPGSRVLTDRGWKPIRDVGIGDMVLTHEGRFRRVTATMVNPAKDKSFVTIIGPTGETVTFTGDHRLLSPNGWYPLDGIIQQELSMLTFDAGILPNATSDEDFNVRLRSAKGSPGEAVHRVRESGAGHQAVAQSGDSQSDDDLDYPRTESAAHTVRRPQRGNQLAAQRRWSLLRVVLGWRPKAHGLSLSMAVDQGAWSDPGRARYSPQGPGVLARRFGQSGVLARAATPATTSSRTGAIRARGAGREADHRPGSRLRAVRQDLSDHRSKKAQSLLLACLPNRIDANRLPVRWLRHALYRQARTWEAPQVLQQGVLPDGTPLFDLTVEGDHSFVIEGIAAHNCKSRCRCAWSITGDEEARHWRARWITEGDANVCDGCRERGRRYADLVMPYEDPDG